MSARSVAREDVAAGCHLPSVTVAKGMGSTTPVSMAKVNGHEGSVIGVENEMTYMHSG